MLSILTREGYELTDDPEETEIAVVNTCSFILDAQDESVNAILEMADLKQSGQLKALIVTGCLAQRYLEDIREEIPEVDGVLGTNSYDKIASAVKNALESRVTVDAAPLDFIPDAGTSRFMTPPFHYSYLKIAEGCDKHCTYCAIPSMRGSYRSVPMEDLLEETRYLCDNGAEEIILVAQETTVYGVDLYGRKSLPELIGKISAVEGVKRIRLLYCYPEEITDELIDVIKSNEKVCHYLDIPIQHIDDDILRRMGRRTDGASIKGLIKRLRDAVPDICLRTTLISGFPGETQEAHERLVDFVKTTGFDRLGVFTYSPQEGTPAASFGDQVDEDVAFERKDEILLAQRDISAGINDGLVGRVLDTVVEGRIPDDGVYVGRTYRDAPDVDGYMFFKSDRDLMSGDVVAVRVTGASEYDLEGVENEFAQ